MMEGSAKGAGADPFSGRTEHGRRDGLQVAAIGMMSGALYLVGYWAQRAIFLNGQGANVAGEAVRGTPPDGERLLVELGVYWGVTAALFVLYALILVLCRRGAMRDGRAAQLALAFPVFFNVGLIFGRPYQSIDALTYAAHGFMGGFGLNPYRTAAAEIAYRDETVGLARELASLGWLPVYGPSPYGALWTWVEVLAASLTGGVGGALLLTKAIVVAASLGCAALIWKILGRVRPEDRLLGTLVYLWNPLIIVEFAGEGHNDALMILLVLVSLLFTVTARPALSLVGMIMGVLVKYLPVIFAPAHQEEHRWPGALGRRCPRLRRGPHRGPLRAVLDRGRHLRRLAPAGPALPCPDTVRDPVLAGPAGRPARPGRRADASHHGRAVPDLCPRRRVAGAGRRRAPAGVRGDLARLPAGGLGRHLALVRGPAARAYGAHPARLLSPNGARRHLHLAPGRAFQQPRQQPLRRLERPHRGCGRRQRHSAARHRAAALRPAPEGAGKRTPCHAGDLGWIAGGGSRGTALPCPTGPSSRRPGGAARVPPLAPLQSGPSPSRCGRT